MTTGVGPAPQLTFKAILLSIILTVILASANAYVGLFGVAAVFTPPDAISMLALAFPLVALYEISILSVVMIERNRAREDAARASTALVP